MKGLSMGYMYIRIPHLQIHCKITSSDHLFISCFYNFECAFPGRVGSGSHKSLAISASMASGEVVEAQRLTTLPSRSIKNFSKFH